MKYILSGLLHVPVSAEIEAKSAKEAKNKFIELAYNEIYTTADNGIATTAGRDSTVAIDDVELFEESIEVEHD